MVPRLFKVISLSCLVISVLALLEVINVSRAVVYWDLTTQLILEIRAASTEPKFSCIKDNSQIY